MKAVTTTSLSILLVVGGFLYAGFVDISPWPQGTNEQVNNSLNSDQEIVKIFTEGHIKKFSSKCGNFKKPVKLKVDFEIPPGASKEWQIDRYQEQPGCPRFYYEVSNENGKLRWAGYFDEKIPYDEFLIFLKSDLKGNLSREKLYSLM